MQSIPLNKIEKECWDRLAINEIRWDLKPCYIDAIRNDLACVFNTSKDWSDDFRIKFNKLEDIIRIIEQVAFIAKNIRIEAKDYNTMDDDLADGWIYPDSCDYCYKFTY